MPEATCLLRPRDPIIVRDGRPFSADPGARAETLPWPLPSTLAGALRTHIGNANNFDWNKDGPDKALNNISTKGPLLVRFDGGSWNVYLSAPADAVVFKDDAGNLNIMRLRPRKSLNNKAGCNIPEGLLPLAIPDEHKPERGYDYWSLEDAVDWLIGKEDKVPDSYLSGLEREARVHVKIDPSKGTSETGMLFATVAICFPDVPLQQGKRAKFQEFETGSNKLERSTKIKPELAMLCHVDCGDGTDLSCCDSGFVPFGGERRVAAIQACAGAWPKFPEKLRNYNFGKHLKLQLITPGLFNQGWKPGWLDDGADKPECLQGVKLKLISAAIPRRIPVSGWDLRKNQPKAARYAVPTGSVYFFEIEEGDIDAEKLWLASISDELQDRRDGFGLVVPGTWDYAEEGN